MRLLAEIGPITLAAGGWLVAEAGGLDPSVANLIGNGVTVAVLCWYVVYDVRIRTPRMLSAFAREQDELRTVFKEEQAGSRETFKTEQREARQTFTLALDAILKTDKEDRAKMREAHAVEIAEWRRMVNDNITAMHGCVTEVKEVVVGKART